MKIEHIYTGCLDGGYYIESDGEAAIVDPLREVEPYIEKATCNNARIRYVLETHFCADFVPAHIELAEKTRAEIICGPSATPPYAARVLRQNESVKLGNITFRTLHTAEEETNSVSYLVFDEFLRPRALFTCDNIAVYPTHSSASVGGKERRRATIDTFGRNKVVQALSADDFEKAASDSGAVILDTRGPGDFGVGFIPNSINIGIDGNFTFWAGSLIPDALQSILLVADKGREEEVVACLARVGLDQTIGYLSGSFATWQKAGKPTDAIPSVSASQFAADWGRCSQSVLDVRKPGEFLREHVSGAINVPLDNLNSCTASIPKRTIGYLYCASNYRSMIALSVLRARGYDNLVNISGGFKAMKTSREISISSSKPDLE